MVSIMQWADHWDSIRSGLFSTLKKDSGKAVFIGDSNTEFFPVSEVFGGNVINRGVSCNNSTHVLNRLSGILANKPSAIFIQIGVNDLWEGQSPDSLLINIGKIVNAIRLNPVNTRIYIQSLFPTGLTYEYLMPDIRKTNELLMEFCNKNDIQFIDVFSYLTKKDTYDGIHLNGAGYKVWESAIRPFVTR